MALSDRTRKNIHGCHPLIIALVVKLDELGYPFIVPDDGGLRTPQRQAELVRTGRSRTMYSRHLTGKAVDIVPVPVDWANAAAFYSAARLVRQAAFHVKAEVVWGGVFDRHLSKLGPDLKAEHEAYIKRKQVEGVKRPFVDLPHFELSRKVYPEKNKES